MSRLESRGRQRSLLCAERSEKPRVVTLECPALRHIYCCQSVFVVTLPWSPNKCWFSQPPRSRCPAASRVPAPSRSSSPPDDPPPPTPGARGSGAGERALPPRHSCFLPRRLPVTAEARSWGSGNHSYSSGWKPELSGLWFRIEEHSRGRGRSQRTCRMLLAETSIALTDSPITEREAPWPARAFSLLGSRILGFAFFFFLIPRVSCSGVEGGACVLAAAVGDCSWLGRGLTTPEPFVSKIGRIAEVGRAGVSECGDLNRAWRPGL